MREILFKAKRIDNEEWGEGSYLYCKKATTVSFRNEHYILVFDGYGVAYHEIDKDTICQYTGLTDKNGNKIWENDVVRYYDDLAEMEKEDLIKWNETHASFTRLHESKMGLQYLYIDECIANRCEVIGNIFDNAELLKVEER